MNAAATWVDAEGSLLPGVVVVALGGNLGGPSSVRQRCESALASLSQAWGSAQVSSYWITAPIGEVQAQPDFLNAVAAWRPAPALSPEAALATLQALEHEHGRTRDIPGGPRTLDLDLLFVGLETRATEALVLPHPRMHQRAFVLRPLQELFGEGLRLSDEGLTLAACLGAPAVAAQITRLAL